MAHLGQGVVDKEAPDRHHLLLAGHLHLLLQHLGLFLLVVVVVVLEHLLTAGQMEVVEVVGLLAGLVELETLQAHLRHKAQTVGPEAPLGQPLLEAGVGEQLLLVEPDQAQQEVREVLGLQIALQALL